MLTLKLEPLFIAYFNTHFPHSFAYEVEILAPHKSVSQNENKNLLDITFEFLGTYMDFKDKIHTIFIFNYPHNCLWRK